MIYFYTYIIYIRLRFCAATREVAGYFVIKRLAEVEENKTRALKQGRCYVIKGSRR